ncbi:MAG: type II toxin-antitoxin system Phd/YefM family antitoxin [Thermodesulfobacteriota bacterium]|nr:type II toxin-antitoxin system Phd/YefM family antitoxin [Thermodesulfobacteriota bacterium]
MTATEFAKNIKKTLDRVEFGGEEIIILRNNHKIARIIPGSPHMTALEAMADLYQTLPPDAAEDWIDDSRIPTKLFEELRDPWDS